MPETHVSFSPESSGAPSQSAAESESRLTQKQSQSSTGIAAGAGSKWLVSLIALPSAIQAFFYLRLLFQLVSVRNEAGYPEGVCVYAFLTSFQTHKLYLPPLDFPWNAQIYGPLFFMVGAFVAKLFHGDPMATTVWTRAFSLLALLGSMALVAFLGWRYERRRTWSMLAIVFGLGCYWLVPYSACTRPDTPSIFFVIAALAVSEVAGERFWLLFLAGVLGAFSFYIKQSTSPLLLALLIDYLLSRRFRAIAAFISGGLAASVPIMLPLWLGHEPFLANFTIIKLAIRNWSSVPGAVASFMMVNQIAVIGLCIALLGCAAVWREKRYRAALLMTAFAWLSGVAGLANPGAGIHYLILPWILTMLFIPAGLKQLERLSARLVWIPVALFLLSTAILVHQKSLLSKSPPPPLDTGIIGSLNMLSGNPYIELRSRRPQLLDPFMYNELAKQGFWSDAPIRQNIDSESYDLLLLDGHDINNSTDFEITGFRGVSFWGGDVLKEMTLHYRVLCDTSNVLALVPANKNSSLTSADITEIFHHPCSASDRRPALTPGYS